MSAEKGDNRRLKAIEAIQETLQSGVHGIKGKERAERLIKLLSLDGLEGEDAKFVDETAEGVLHIHENSIERIRQINDLIDESNYLNNGVTKYKNFRRKIINGDSPEECIVNVKLWLEGLNHLNLAKDIAGEVDKLLAMDAQDIHALSRQYKFAFPEGKGRFVQLFNEFRERDFKNDPEYLDLFLYLVDLISKYTEVPLFCQPMVEVAHQYFNGLRLVRLIEEEMATENDHKKIVNLFFELGGVCEEVASYGFQSDFRVASTLDSRRAANTCRRRHAKNNSIRQFDKQLYDITVPAWELGCKLLHTQMAIVLHMGVLSQKPDEKNVANVAKKLTNFPIALKEGSDDRVQDYCPCDALKDICSIGKLLQKKKKAYLLKFAHKQNSRESLKSWQFKSVDEVKATLYKLTKS